MSYRFKFDRVGLMIAIKEYLGPIHTAIEVGTYQGFFADVMIHRLNPGQFYAVDPLRLFPGMNSNPGHEFGSQQKLDKLAEQVSQKLSNSGHTLIREVSEKASLQFDDNSVDVVYLDADHSYTGCSNDIDFWYPKIRDGGILAGHDYCNGNPQKGHVYGVIQAVAQLVDEHDLELFVTSDAYPSWMVVKGNHTTQSLKAQTV